LNVLANVIKIDPYNFELYRFKVGAVFEAQCTISQHRLKGMGHVIRMPEDRPAKPAFNWDPKEKWRRG